jgi:hypothetical protein
MEVYFVKYCDQCNQPIVPGQKWVRTKVPGSLTYNHFHLDLFVHQELSCWEKRLNGETARAN